jgi:hypothetical protein
MPFGSSANPRRYKGIVAQARTMQYWQHDARPAARASLQRLPARLLKNLFRRLERWTWWRVINGEQYFLLYRGISPGELNAMGDPLPGDWVTFSGRASYTIDGSVAATFSQRYGGKFIGVWVPASAIVTAPVMYGPNMLPSYDAREFEIIVDPFRGEIQDSVSAGEWFTFSDATFKFVGPDHPWSKMDDVSRAKFNAEMDAGNLNARFLRHMNPLIYRPVKPHPDAHIRMYGLFG